MAFRISCFILALIFVTIQADEASRDIETHLFDPVDTARDRTVPVKVYRKENGAPQPVVLFSHGLGGSRNNNPYLGNHWAAAGYTAVFVQHPGTDESVWKDAPIGERFAALKAATSPSLALERFRDIPFVLDQLDDWNADASNPLHGKLDLERIGMAGHSYGAVTTLAMTDRNFRTGQSLHDPRIDAFLPMSPQPGKGSDPASIFGDVSVPVLCMTGTEDGSPIEPDLEPSDRQKVYAAFPSGDKFQLVLYGAEHHAFGESDGRRTRGRNPSHHPAIQMISTKFWDAYLKTDDAAKAWLQSDSVLRESGLSEDDTWEWK